MIRGTNRCAVEISSTGSPYFERAICFVRPQFTDGSRLSLHKAAREMIKSLDSSVEPLTAEDGEHSPQGGRLRRAAASAARAARRVPLWLLTLIPALIGALVSLILCAILMR